MSMPNSGMTIHTLVLTVDSFSCNCNSIDRSLSKGLQEHFSLSSSYCCVCINTSVFSNVNQFQFVQQCIQISTRINSSMYICTSVIVSFETYPIVNKYLVLNRDNHCPQTKFGSMLLFYWCLLFCSQRVGVGFSVRITDHMTSLPACITGHMTREEGCLHSAGAGGGRWPASRGGESAFRREEGLHQGGWADPPCWKWESRQYASYWITKSVKFGRFAYREILNTHKILTLSCYSYLSTSALPRSNETIIKMLTLWLKTYFIIGGSRGGVRDARPPWASKFFRFHAVFGKIWRVHAPPWRVHAPPSGKSWIRHCLFYYLSKFERVCRCWQVGTLMSIPYLLIWDDLITY